MYAFVEAFPPMSREPPSPHSLAEIAKRLRLLREALDNTQASMASLAGVTPAAWGNYESGLRRIRVDEALRLCSALGVTLDWVYRGNMSQLPIELGEKLQLELRARQRRVRN